jgi:1,4-dihydroxy-2-naphthoate octaprenyltransferase
MSEGSDGPTLSIRLPEVSRLTPALDLLAGALLYGLGVAIARFVGIPIDGNSAALGWFVMVSGHAGLHLLTAFLRIRSQPPDPEEAPSQIPASPIQRIARVPFLATLLALTFWATGLSAALLQGSFPPLAWALLALVFGVGLAWVHPSVPLRTSGYGEVVLSITLAGLVPAFAFSIQSSLVNPLLLFSVAPLMAFHFSMLIVFQLRRFGADSRLGRGTLSVRIGWPRAMAAHDVALLTGLLLVAVALFFGLPGRVGFGFLLVVPLAFAQIWQMDRIRRAFPARWNLLTAVAMATFGLALYLELTGFLLTMA